jgi:DNA replicative helicase MCM subunit Mcm2 (Cdc46/Mcm family)
VTIVGPGRDGAEWSVFLKGNRLDDVNPGDRLKVRGVLRVIEHPPARVNGMMVPAWTEVRVTEG